MYNKNVSTIFGNKFLAALSMCRLSFVILLTWKSSAVSKFHDKT